MSIDSELSSTHLFDLAVELEPRIDLGPGPLGQRVFDRVRSGTFAGPRLRGEVLPGSADPLLRGADGIAAIDARAVLRTDDGAHILMSYAGRIVIPADVVPQIADVANWHRIDPARYYIRCAPVFETGDPRYTWLNGIVAVGQGHLAANGGLGYRISAV
jgi:hypothetical protein